MALHAKRKKTNKINKVLISIFPILVLLVLISWSWLLLYFPYISNRAEFFIKGHLSKIFVASEDLKKLDSTDQSKQQSGDNTEDQNFLGPEGSPDNKNQSKDTSKSGDKNSEKEDQRPTIRLQIYEGPVYSASDDTCYYVVRAVVTGKPTPTIKFSKDDSSGALDLDKVKINLTRNMRTYTLTATASNYLGTVMDSITLNWGCNSSPVIAEIVLSSDIVYVDNQYEITAKASDPDGDSLLYKWAVSGGSLTADDQATVKWNTPSKADNYDVKVVVKDSKGANSSKSVLVYVGEVEVTETTPETQEPPPTTTTEPPATTTTEPPTTNLNLPKKTNEGGFLEYGGNTYPGGNVYAGDSAGNKPCVGFISFDISGLSGKTVDAATLTFSNVSVSGNPFEYLDSYWINVVEWGVEPIVQNDFNLTGIAIQNFNNPSITCTAGKLKSELQKAINGGKSRFQIRVHFSGPYTDNDNSKDGWEYSQSSINLNVKLS